MIFNSLWDMHTSMKELLSCRVHNYSNTFFLHPPIFRNLFETCYFARNIFYWSQKWILSKFSGLFHLPCFCYLPEEGPVRGLRRGQHTVFVQMSACLSVCPSVRLSFCLSVSLCNLSCEQILEKLQMPQVCNFVQKSFWHMTIIISWVFYFSQKQIYCVFLKSQFWKIYWMDCLANLHT